MLLKEQIIKLLALQTLDSQIYALKNEKEAIPQQLEALKEKFEATKESLKAYEKKTQELLSEKKAKELELASKEEQAKKLQTQLYQLKTNKEYSAMLKEIEGVKADGSQLEDQILNVMEALEAEKINVQKGKDEFAKEEVKFKEEEKKIQQRTKEIEQRLTQLGDQRKGLTVDIESRVLAHYDKILNNRDGLALARVIDNACEGCRMSLPPQVINLIKMYERLISCEVCQRILYIEEEIPQGGEQPKS